MDGFRRVDGGFREEGRRGGWFRVLGGSREGSEFIEGLGWVSGSFRILGLVCGALRTGARRTSSVLRRARI